MKSETINALEGVLRSLKAKENILSLHSGEEGELKKAIVLLENYIVKKADSI